MSLWLSREGYRHSGPCESPPVLLWLHAAPQRSSALRWGRLAKSSSWQKPGTAPKSRPKPALSWHTGAKEELASLQGSREKRKGHNSFCPAPRHGSGNVWGPPHHSWLHQDTAQMMLGGEGPACAPSTACAQPALQGLSHCTEQNCKSPNTQASWAPLPSHSGTQLHLPQDTQGTAISTSL